MAGVEKFAQYFERYLMLLLKPVDDGTDSFG